MKTVCSVLMLFVISTCILNAQQAPVHGLWVRKTPELLDLPSRGEALRNFCRSNQINEVYLSYTSQNGGAAEQQEIQRLINLLHHAHIRVEALLSSKDADEAGNHRDKLVEHANQVVDYNQHHAHQRFDGIHLDIRPQDRVEYQGAGKLGYLPGLLAAYLAVRNVADIHQLTVNADIPLDLLQVAGVPGSLAAGVEVDPAQRRALMTSVTRLTLMLDGVAPAQVNQAAANAFTTAYQGLDGANPAQMAIGLRYNDDHQQLSTLLQSVQSQMSANPHFLGWAWDSYNDVTP